MHYVEDKLGGDSLMQKLDQAQDGATEQLIEGLTSKASGVFLWVSFFFFERADSRFAPQSQLRDEC